jgi:hypothetical protein
VPNGTAGRPGAPLTVRKAAATPDLVMRWSTSCSPEAIDYTVQEGAIGSWYSHSAVLCDTGGALVNATLTPGDGSRYFLVVPVTVAAEGSYGLDSLGRERPRSSATCRPTRILGCP